MKKMITALLFAAPLAADYDLANVSGWEMSQQANLPYTFEVSGDWIGDSKFTKDSVRGDHVRFGIWEAEFQATVLHNPDREEGLALALSFDQTHLDWDCNPFFDRRNFNTASFTLLGFSHRFCNWNLVGQFSYRIDTCKWGFVDYSSYDWLLWGRWSYRENIGLHLGVYAQTGLRLPLVLPILGFDWRLDDRWKLSAVFPVNFSLNYALDCDWTMALRGRFWSSRSRAGKHEHLSKAVWRYTNYGLEVATLYGGCDWITFDLHGGCTFGGRVKVAHRRGSHSHTLRFNPGAYVGGELAVSF